MASVVRQPLSVWLWSNFAAILCGVSLLQFYVVSHYDKEYFTNHSEHSTPSPVSLLKPPQYINFVNFHGAGVKDGE